jgi:hypothetical protein
MTRFWITFKIDTPEGVVPPFPRNYGVTAFDLEDALRLLKEAVFRDRGMYEIESVVPDVDVSALDPDHVLPNIGVPAGRGIWYPRGYGEMR